MGKATAGDTVRVHYKGYLEDGATFDTSEGRDPLECELGSGQIIRGFDDGLQGMEVGESKTITIPPEEAYGPRVDDAIQEFPLDKIPDGIPTDPGTQLQMQGPQGQVIPVTVVDKGEETLTLDANHPLAGKTLKFDVTLVEIV